MRTTLIASVILLAACANPQPAASKTEPKRAAAPPVAESGPRTPLQVSWNEKLLSPHSALLEARVQYNGPFDVPVHVMVQLPAGASLTRGEAQLDVPAQTTATTVVNEYEVAFGEVPAADLVLVADGKSESSGVHATALYRFGRPAPQAVTPQANGPELKLNGNNFGHAIPLQPAQK
jgi:hypothetical protein